MQQTTKKITDGLATVIPSLLILSSGAYKLAGVKSMQEKLSAMGVGPYIPVFGIMEMAFTLLFIFPRTMRIGFILLSCYFAGAIATDLSHGNSILNAMLPMTLLWAGMLVRDKSFFVKTRVHTAAR